MSKTRVSHISKQSANHQDANYPSCSHTPYHSEVLTLQRLIGNRAIQRVLVDDKGKKLQSASAVKNYFSVSGISNRAQERAEHKADFHLPTNVSTESIQSDEELPLIGSYHHIIGEHHGDGEFVKATTPWSHIPRLREGSKGIPDQGVVEAYNTEYGKNTFNASIGVDEKNKPLEDFHAYAVTELTMFNQYLRSAQQNKRAFNASDELNRFDAVNDIASRYRKMAWSVLKREGKRYPFSLLGPNKREQVYLEIGEYIADHTKDFQQLLILQKQKEPVQVGSLSDLGIDFDLDFDLKVEDSNKDELLSDLNIHDNLEVGNLIEDKSSDTENIETISEKKELITPLEENNEIKIENNKKSSDDSDSLKLNKEEEEQIIRLQKTISGLVLLITKLLQVPENMIKPLTDMNEKPTVDGDISATLTALSKGNPIREKAMIENINNATPPVFVQVGTEHVKNLAMNTKFSKGYPFGSDFTDDVKK
jgi:hypothetical protein